MLRLPFPDALFPAGTLPAGFAMNGSSNTALKAMLARVANGTGRGRIVFKGDSTTAGSSELATNARTGRVSRYLADELTGAGYAALDGSFVGDQNSLVAISTYDTRVSFSNGVPWTQTGGQAFAGGNYFVSTDNAFLTFTPTVPTDTCEFVVFNTGGFYGFLVDSGGPASVTGGIDVGGGQRSDAGTSSGFTRFTLKASAPGMHSYTIARQSGTARLRSGTAYDAATGLIDILNHAAGGATSTDQAAAGSGWLNNDALAFDAPDLTIINCVLNVEPNPSQLATNLNAMIAKAKLSGDVLLVAPHEATPGFRDLATQAARRQIANDVAAGAGVAFLDLTAQAPFSTWQEIEAAGLFVSESIKVHLKTAGYAMVASRLRAAIQAMAGLSSSPVTFLGETVTFNSETVTYG